LNKYLEAVNNKFAVGMRFKMRFEGEDSPERRWENYRTWLLQAFLFKVGALL
jgi:hypothetical protein